VLRRQSFGDDTVPIGEFLHHGGTIRSTAPLTVETGPGQWAYAVSLPVTLAGRRAPLDRLPVQVSIRVRVESGLLGCLLVGDDWTTLYCRTPVTVDPGQGTAELVWEQGDRRAHLVFRNHGADGLPCVFAVESIALAPVPPPQPVTPPVPSRPPDYVSRLDDVLVDGGRRLDVARLRGAVGRAGLRGRHGPHDGTSHPSAGYLDVVPVGELHARLGLSVPLDYAGSLVKPFNLWKMEVDDAPILAYLYRHLRPSRHLEFGTWEGFGTCLCLDECDATVWTINLPGGELVEGVPAYSSPRTIVPAGATPREARAGTQIYQTDAGPFIGHLYRSRGLGHRVHQILCDSRDWDASAHPEGFFDSAYIDGGHSPDVVSSDTRKALEVVRPGGLILWHDFCPDPGVFETMHAVAGVVESITKDWNGLRGVVRDVFWIRPSFLLAAIR